MNKLTNNKQYFDKKMLSQKIKLNKLPKTLNTSRSLKDSRISQKPLRPFVSFHKSNSFYNDRKQIYIKKSRALSEKSLSFQSKNISLFQRKRYQSSRIEDITVKRKQQQKDREVLKSNSLSLKDKFRQISKNKYKKILMGKQLIQVNKSLLQKDIRSIISQKKLKPWKSPFNQNSLLQKVKTKSLSSKSITPILPPSNPNQLKVLNLDRMFRNREGKLTNIVPLPSARLNQINKKEHIHKYVNSQQKVHEAVKEFNKLLMIQKFKKITPKLGIRGKNFIKSPTIQQIIGIKLGYKKQFIPQRQSISSQTLLNSCIYFKKSLKKDQKIYQRVLYGLLKQGNDIEMKDFINFWQIFVSQNAKIQQKQYFLLYFLFPKIYKTINLDQIKQILSILCKNLPHIENFNTQSQNLSNIQKSIIFLQALMKVLFGELKNVQIQRQILNQILYINPDACNLILKLMKIQQ